MFKSVLVLSKYEKMCHVILPRLAMTYSTIEAGGKDLNCSEIILKVPEVNKKNGLKLSDVWPWLKNYIKHTIHACKLSFRDIKKYYDERGNHTKESQLTNYLFQKRVRRDMIKLIPFSVFIVVPFAELLIPVYLLIYQNAIPWRFLTTKGKEKKDYRISVQMIESQDKFRNRLLERLEELQNLGPEDINSIQIIKKWLREGFDYKKDMKDLPIVNQVFKKHICPIIESDKILLRELMFSMGITRLTGLHYINHILRSIKLTPVTLASPIIRTVFSWYTRNRISIAFNALEQSDKYLSREEINKQNNEIIRSLAQHRAIVPLMKTRSHVVDMLNKWNKLRNLHLHTSLIIVANICIPHTQKTVQSTNSPVS